MPKSLVSFVEMGILSFRLRFSPRSRTTAIKKLETDLYSSVFQDSLRHFDIESV